MDSCTPVTVCRCCGGESLVTALDLGDMPLANAFRAGGGDCRRYPLRLMACRDCSHGQLSVTVSGEVLFRDYAYLSGGSETFKRHCRGIVAAAKGAVPAGAPRVLDIGCNDGTLLALFRAAGCDVLGVDPAANLADYARRSGVPAVHEFWGADFAASLSRKFDVITAQNVFAHVPDPADFLAGCVACLADGGAVLIEFPHALEMVRRNEFDTIYHEHLSYFTAASFARLVGQSDLCIEGVTWEAVHGGSLRFVLRKRSGPHCPAAVAELIDRERSAGMFDLSAYRGFGARVAANRAALRGLVSELRGRGEKVVGYCASAKGVIAINYCGLDLDYVVDDTPLKQGRFIPGTGIPVVMADVLAGEPSPINIVVLAWNWLDEVARRVQSLRGDVDRLITYVPEVSVREPAAVASRTAAC